MKIEFKDIAPPQVTAGDFNNGEVFEYCGSLYMVVGYSNGLHFHCMSERVICVQMVNGRQATFKKDTIVNKVDCVLTVRNIKPKA